MSPEMKEQYTQELIDSLDEKHVEFAKEYSVGEHRGNGIQSYAKVYNKNLSDKTDYNACRNGTNYILKKDNVIKLIDIFIFNEGLNQAMVDSHLLWLIQQQQDLHAKLGAIKEYNKIAGRITDKLDIKTTSEPINYSKLSDEELAELVRLLNKTKEHRDNEVRTD